MIKTSCVGGGGDTTTGVIKTSSARSRQRGNTTTGVIKTSCVVGGGGDTTTGVIKTSSARSRQRGNTTTGVIKTSCVVGGGDTTTGVIKTSCVVGGGRYDYWRDQDFFCSEQTTGQYNYWRDQDFLCWGGGQWGDMTTGIANRRLLLEGVLWGDNGTVERGSSVVECRTRNQVSPDSNPPLLPFRRLGIFVLSIESIWL